MVRPASFALRRALPILITGVAVLGVAGSCRPRSDEQSRTRLSKIETSMAQMSGMATRLNTLEGKGQGVEAQMGELSRSVSDLQTSVAGVQKDVGLQQGGDAALRKKVDAMAAQVTALGSRVGALDQRIALLETRYNDHLRKYHGG